jgi:hypothetical protein
MNLKKNNDRKGLAGTILFHAIIALLMLLWAFAPPIEEDEDDGGVLVSFGEVDGGGPEDINSVAEEIEESTPPEASDPVDDPVITNDDVNAPVLEEKKKEKVTEKKKEEPTIDKEMQERIERMKKANAEKSKSSGPEGGDGPKGDKNSTEPGKGGSGKGTIGSGISYNLKGFKITGSANIENEKQEFGTVVLDICVDKSGRLLSINRGAGTTNLSQHLFDLSKRAVSDYSFIPQGSVENTNCGTITIVYKPK